METSLNDLNNSPHDEHRFSSPRPGLSKDFKVPVGVYNVGSYLCVLLM